MCAFVMYLVRLTNHYSSTFGTAVKLGKFAARVMTNGQGGGGIIIIIRRINIVIKRRTCSRVFKRGLGSVRRETEKKWKNGQCTHIQQMRGKCLMNEARW